MKNCASLLPAVFLCFLVWGCSQAPPAVIIEDDAKLFETPVRPAPAKKKGASPKAQPGPAPALTRQELETRLQALARTKGIDIVVHTASTPGLSGIDLPAYLDVTFEKDPAWKTVPRSGWFSRVLQTLRLRSRAPADSAEFVVLASPKFLAVRFGNSARLRALSAGMMSSPELFAIQQRATADPTAALKEMLGVFEQRYPPRTEDSWRERIVRWFFYEDLDHILTSVTLNHWKTYNRFLLGPTLYLQAQAARYVPLWTAPFLGILVVLGIASRIKALLSKGMKYKGVPGWLCLALVVAVELAGLTPSIGSLVFISHQRLEDRLFVQSLLSPELVQLSPLFSGLPANLAGNTGFWWAIGFSLIIPISLLSEGFWLIPMLELPSEAQNQIYEDLSGAGKLLLQGLCASYSNETRFDEDKPYDSVAEAMVTAMFLRPIKYFFLFLYLPFPISLVLCNRMLFKIVGSLRRNWKHYGEYRMIAAYNKAQTSSSAKAAG